MEQVVNRALIVSRASAAGTRGAVAFAFSGDTMTVSARNSDGEHVTEPMDIEVIRGTPFDFKVDGDWLLKHLSRIRTEHVCLGANGPEAPMRVLADEEEPDAVSLVMFLKLGS